MQETTAEGVNDSAVQELHNMPPKHRPSPLIPKGLEFATSTIWLPFTLFWVLVLGITFAIWLAR